MPGDLQALTQLLAESVEESRNLMSTYVTTNERLTEAEKELVALKERVDQPRIYAGEAALSAGRKALNFAIGSAVSACLAAFSLCFVWKTNRPPGSVISSGWSVFQGQPSFWIIVTFVLSIGEVFVYLIAISLARLSVRRLYADGNLTLVMTRTGYVVGPWASLTLAAWTVALVVCSIRLHSVLIVDKGAVPLTFAPLASAVFASQIRVVALVRQMIDNSPSPDPSLASESDDTGLSAQLDVTRVWKSQA
jgi:hypothetical protein